MHAMVRTTQFTNFEANSKINFATLILAALPLQLLFKLVASYSSNGLYEHQYIKYSHTQNVYTYLCPPLEKKNYLHRTFHCKECEQF